MQHGVFAPLKHQECEGETRWPPGLCPMAGGLMQGSPAGLTHSRTIPGITVLFLSGKNPLRGFGEKQGCVCVLRPMGWGWVPSSASRTEPVQGQGGRESAVLVLGKSPCN